MSERERETKQTSLAHFRGKVSGCFDGAIAVLASRMNSVEKLVVFSLNFRGARFKQKCFVLDSWLTARVRRALQAASE